MKNLIQALSVLGLMLLAAPAGAAEVSPQSVDGATTIDTATAKQLFERGVAFVDVRKDTDWEAGRVPGAYHLELKTVLNEEALSKIAGKNEELVIYCNGESCLRSSKASAKAVDWGFTNVKYFRDGFPAWRLASYPVE